MLRRPHSEDNDLSCIYEASFTFTYLVTVGKTDPDPSETRTQHLQTGPIRPPLIQILSSFASSSRPTDSPHLHLCRQQDTGDVRMTQPHFLCEAHVVLQPEQLHFTGALLVALPDVKRDRRAHQIRPPAGPHRGRERGRRGRGRRLVARARNDALHAVMGTASFERIAHVAFIGRADWGEAVLALVKANLLKNIVPFRFKSHRLRHHLTSAEWHHKLKREFDKARMR